MSLETLFLRKHLVRHGQMLLWLHLTASVFVCPRPQEHHNSWKWLARAEKFCCYDCISDHGGPGWRQDGDTLMYYFDDCPDEKQLLRKIDLPAKVNS